ncbi:MAG: hypothetical protein PWP54_1076 [Thermosipho sp. (in: thermotogales)]|nr:hypothetical protein [Thermosipho sp. (in: thermotogales)]
MFVGIEFSNVPFPVFSSDMFLGLSLKIKFDYLYFVVPLIQINSEGKFEKISFDEDFFTKNLFFGFEYNHNIYKDSVNFLKTSISGDFPLLNLISEKRIQPLNFKFGLGIGYYSYEINLGKVVRFEFFNANSKNLIYGGIFYITPGLNL